MSLNFISKFQTRLYYILANDAEIRQFVERIYVSVVKDARQPFLLINIQKIKDLSVKAQNIYEVEFKICAFTRDRTQSLLPSLAEKVYQSLTCNVVI